MIIIWPKLITLNEVCFICIWKVEHATSFSFWFLLTQISKVSMCQFSSPVQSAIHWTDDWLNQSSPRPFGPDWIFSPADWTSQFHTLLFINVRQVWVSHCSRSRIFLHQYSFSEKWKLKGNTNFLLSYNTNFLLANFLLTDIFLRINASSFWQPRSHTCIYFTSLAARRLVLPATAGGAQHTETATPAVKISCYNSSRSPSLYIWVESFQIWCFHSSAQLFIIFQFESVRKPPSMTHPNVHIRFPDLANGWADCVQIWCVARYPLDKCFTHVWGGVHLHVRTCKPLFQISQTAGRIAFKFCVWLGAQ